MWNMRRLGQSKIPDGELLEGALPGKQYKLVQAWMGLHADELMATGNWPLLVLHPTKLIH